MRLRRLNRPHHPSYEPDKAAELLDLPASRSDVVKWFERDQVLQLAAGEERAESCCDLRDGRPCLLAAHALASQ